MAADEAGPIGYEQARAELEDVVRALETGAPTLEESLRLWERGEELAAVCARWLEGAQARLLSPDSRGDGPGVGPGDGAETDRSDGPR